MSTPIQFDPDALRRSLAITPTIAPPVPQGQPPAVSLPSAAPDLGVTVPHQSVQAPRGTLQGDTDERGRLLSSGSGESQIYKKVTGSQFGQNHPVLGKILGGLGQGLATAGDIGLSAVAPSLAINIPGTAYHHQMLVNQANRQVGEETKEGQEEAQAGEANARANALNNPADEFTQIPTTSGYDILSRKTGEAKPLMVNGEQAQPVEKEQQPHFVSMPDGSVVGIQTDPKTGEMKASVAYKGDPKVQTQLTQLEIGGKPHQVIVNKDTGEQIKDLGETGEKPPTVNVNAGQNEADKIAARLGKPYEGMNTAATSQLDKIDEAMSMIHGNAEAQALGIPKTMTALVSGQGSGVRITQAELNMIAKARGIQGDFEGYVNKLSGKGTLTPTQVQQISGVLQDAKQRILLKQQIANQTLDTINGATSRDQIVQADQQARKLFGQLEKYGRYEGERLPDGRTIQRIYEQDGKVKVDVAQ